MARPPKLAAALALLAALSFTACGNDGSDQASAPVGAGDPEAGEQVYGDFCGACHGRDFEGSVQGPSHLDPHFEPATTSDEDYRNAIRNGVDQSAFDFGPMPAIRSLDDQQIADVIAYIRSVQQERGFEPSP
ncbi:MAG: cytochrome c [Microthrixaceae bacterium]